MRDDARETSEDSLDRRKLLISGRYHAGGNVIEFPHLMKEDKTYENAVEKANGFALRRM